MKRLVIQTATANTAFIDGLLAKQQIEGRIEWHSSGLSWLADAKVTQELYDRIWRAYLDEFPAGTAESIFSVFAIVSEDTTPQTEEFKPVQLHDAGALEIGDEDENEDDEIHLQSGVVLIATNQCKMTNGKNEGEPTLTVDKKYEIMGRSFNTITVIDDLGEPHSFYICEPTTEQTKDGHWSKFFTVADTVSQVFQAPAATNIDELPIFTPVAARTPWDAIEIHGCVEEGGNIEQEDDDSKAHFFGVYLHQVGGGLDCIADFKTRKQAEDLKTIILNACNNDHRNSIASTGALPTDQFLADLEAFRAAWEKLSISWNKEVADAIGGRIVATYPFEQPFNILYKQVEAWVQDIASHTERG